MNFFQPQMKLLTKTRQGSRVTKRFDLAQTPYQRVLASPHVSEQSKQALEATFMQLNPAQLKRHITACQDHLLELSNNKPERREVKPPADYPFHEHYSRSHRSRTSLVRQPI